MVGQLNKMDLLRSEVILLKWVIERIESQDWNKFKDLHISELQIRNLDKTDWIKAGLELMSKVYSDFNMNEHTLLFTIPLNCSDESKKEKEYLNLSDLDNDSNSTPPSFYLFQNSSENLKMTLKYSNLLDRLSDNLGFKFHYNEKQEGNEFYRTLFVAIK